MKQIFYILTIFLSLSLYGQNKDKRAELDIEGRVSKISVAPDEKIWLVTNTGNTYYTENIDSNWHYGKPIFKASDEFGSDNPSLEEISFFNKDTAIMTGFISTGKEEYNGLYFTKDGGSSWRMIDFGGDSWIYNVFIDKNGNGNTWMGGSSGEIYFSNDFGQHWKKLNSPYNSSSRMNSIFMTNSTNGISGALDNDIYITSDNWKTSKKIATPYDQKKYTNGTDYFDDRIEKILLWNNYIVVNQNGHIYYTEADKVEWKPFPTKVYDFELDNESNILFAITDSLQITYFTSPAKFQLLTDKRLKSFPIDIRVVNHSLFVVSNNYDSYDVTKVNKKGPTNSIPYTTDKKISEPRIIKQGSKITWGINGNQIYLAEDTKLDWYRENTLDFSVSDFMLLNDSVAILWDGIKDNYIYSLKEHTPKKYFPESPLKTFLASPIKTFTINSGSQGCGYGDCNEVNYLRVNDSIFSTATVHYKGKESSAFNNTVKKIILTKILTAINSNPSAIPALKDFQITEKDKKKYFELVDKQLKRKDADNLSGKKKVSKEFYYAVPAMLDTLGPSIITNILNQQEGIWSTTRNWFTIEIVNENNDTLNISRNYYINTLPWNLPWKFEYKGINFNCYNVAFSKFIDTCIPKKFMDKEVFNNSMLIMAIADFLWNKEN